MKLDTTFYRDMGVEEATWRASKAMQSIGWLTTMDYKTGDVQGRVSHAPFRFIDVKVAIREHEKQSIITVSTSFSDFMEYLLESAANCFRNSFDNFDKPGYRPDEIGIPSRIYTWLVIAFFAMAALAVHFHLLPRTR